MKGIINKGIKELVIDRFGDDAWEKVLALAKCKESFFSVSDDYPDQMTLDLVEAACQVSGLSEDQVLFEFGRFWVTHTGVQSYPSYFKLAGKNAREFLLNMDKVHVQVTKNVINVSPPRFGYEQLEDGRLLMHYTSERGFCSALRGLIVGVGDFFHEKLEVHETTCMKKGDPRCTMEVSFS